jgi:threonine/homoserine/homoserine lactone efflux protein
MLVFSFGFLWLGDLIGGFLSTGQTASAVEWSVGIILLGLSLPLLTKIPRVLPTDETRFTDEYLGTLDRSANDAFVLGLTLQTTLLAAAAAGIVSSDALPNLILVLVVVQVLTYSASALARDRRAGKRRQAQAKEQSPS